MGDGGERRVHSIGMACMMGYIKHFDGRLKGGLLYVGWVDSKNDEPVDDNDVRECYEKETLTYAGLRMLPQNPKEFEHYLHHPRDCVPHPRPHHQPR
jgi:3-oxoacyl-ACP reductase-like protein